MTPQRIYVELYRADKLIRPTISVGAYEDVERRLNICRELWIELHTKQDPNPEWFADWLSRVPNFDCKCRTATIKYLKTNPPVFDQGYRKWTIDLHNSVNIKLEKPEVHFSVANELIEQSIAKLRNAL
jgi:hypothetical protein